MLDNRFSRKENATTTDATAKATHDSEKNNGRRLRRPSRSAMRQTQSLAYPIIGLKF
jgi:hypothetical protein